MNAEFKTLLGRTIVRIDTPPDELIFHCDDGAKFRMFHQQDCCEAVYLEDIAGDLKDLIGDPVVRAEEPSSMDGFEDTREDSGSVTWTFYIIGTKRGTVTLRWNGSSNGYYSESVDFEEIRNARPRR